MREPEFDPRFVDWLSDGPSAPSDWVLPAVEHHARRHPHRRALLARWSDAMKAMALRHPVTPAARALALVAALAVAVALGGLILSGAPGLIGGPVVTSPTPPMTNAPMSPTPGQSASAPSAAPTPAPSPAALDPASMLTGYLPAWHRGDVAWGRQWLAPDHSTVLITDPPDLQFADSAHHFEIVPDGRGYVYWEPRGDPFHGGSYWALPSVAGVWDPGSLVWAVFRLDREGRIAVQWLLARPNPLGQHEATGTYATAAPKAVVAFLQGCNDARQTSDRATALACYDSAAGTWISANGGGGAWTETYTGEGAVEAWLDAFGAYRIIERTGDVVMLGDLAAYPFRQQSSSCAAGIDVFELSAGRSKILSHWTFCGPDPLPPVSLPSELVGTWGDPSRLAVTLGACDASGVCGDLRRRDGETGENCVYPLTYRGAEGAALAFETTSANTFGCGWSGWVKTTVLVEPAPDGLTVSALGSTFTLSRTAPSTNPSTAP